MIDLNSSLCFSLTSLVYQHLVSLDVFLVHLWPIVPYFERRNLQLGSNFSCSVRISLHCFVTTIVCSSLLAVSVTFFAGPFFCHLALSLVFRYLRLIIFCVLLRLILLPYPYFSTIFHRAVSLSSIFSSRSLALFHICHILLSISVHLSPPIC